MSCGVQCNVRQVFSLMETRDFAVRRHAPTQSCLLGYNRSRESGQTKKRIAPDQARSVERRSPERGHQFPEESSVRHGWRRDLRLLWQESCACIDASGTPATICCCPSTARVVGWLRARGLAMATATRGVALSKAAGCWLHNASATPGLEVPHTMIEAEIGREGICL
jgi:hypothetical protein